MANTDGGYILYGIYEDVDEEGRGSGVPREPIGLEIPNYDILETSLVSRARDGITPRIPELRFRRIDGLAGGSIVALRVGASWNGPHMVTFDGRTRFYGRSAASRYLMDWDQIRRAFLVGADAVDQVRSFQRERVRVIGSTPPVRFTSNGPKLILHLIPLSSAARSSLIDVTAVQNVPHLMPFGHDQVFEPALTFDGFLVSSPNRGEARDYALLFRNGAFEAVDDEVVYRQTDGSRLISAWQVEEELIDGLRRYLTVGSRVGLGAPWVIFVSLLGVTDVRLETGGRPYFQMRARALDRDRLDFPEILLSDAESDPADFLRPMFDMFWQSFGYERSLNYDNDGLRRRLGRN